MDGAGEIPKACGYRALDVATYTRRSSSPVTLEIYDMGSGANAFGLYSMKRNPAGPFINLDHPAQLGAGELLFWKGRYTVIVAADNPKQILAADLLTLGKAAAARISDRGDLPDLLRYLPRDGYRDNSVRYFHGKMALDTIKFIRENLFALSPQTEVVVASYEQPKGKLMLIRYPSTAAAESAMNGCRQAPAARSISVMRQGRLIGAAWDAGTASLRAPGGAARPLLDRLRHTLQRPGSPWTKA
jgi:hypothetical protein